MTTSFEYAKISDNDEFNRLKSIANEQFENLFSASFSPSANIFICLFKEDTVVLSACLSTDTGDDIFCHLTSEAYYSLREEVENLRYTLYPRKEIILRPFVRTVLVDGPRRTPEDYSDYDSDDPDNDFVSHSWAPLEDEEECD